MAENSSINGLPPELLIEILSRLSWRQQLGVRRVSRRWQTAVDACLVRRQELYISREDEDIGLSAKRLLNLLKSMPELRQFRVEPWYELMTWDDLSVDRLCTSCPRLQVISLTGIDEVGLETLLFRLPDLRSLHLTSGRVKGYSLSLVPMGMLQSLTLKATHDLDTANLRHLTRCTQLRELDLSYNGVRSEELEAVVAACPKLERLVVTYCFQLTWDWLPKLRRCPQMRDLDLSMTSVCSKDLAKAVAACPQLERLTVAGCNQSTWTWLSKLTHCSRLQELDISGGTDYRVMELYQAEYLGVIRNDMRNPLTAFPTISLPRLTHLDISHTKADDNTFRRLPDLLPDLRHLNITGCYGLTNGGLASVLPRLTSLQVLDMRCRKLGSPETLVPPSGLPLKALGCDYSAKQVVSDVLRRCPSLTVLRLTEIKPESARGIAADLVRHPLPADRKVTLIVDCLDTAKLLSSEVPKNVRVMHGREGLWEKMTGWLMRD